MHVVRIRLIKSNSFWFLNNLRLGPENSVSDPIDLDALDNRTRDKIEKAEESFGLIKVIPQPEGVKPTFEVEKSSPVSYALPRYRSISKIVKDKAKQVEEKEPPEKPESESEEFPEIQSVTVEEDSVTEEISEPEEPEIKKVEPTEEDFEEARLLLKQNGNTVKRVLRHMDKPADEAKRFLLACLEVEKDRKKRKGTIATLEEAYLEVS